jgi:4-diphosphocytidyl-2-C-methyl-D-erythritol kinase
MIRERAFGKVNLVLHVGRPRPDGLHPVCSLFASIDLADELTLREAARDAVRCPGVEGDNAAARALLAFRRAAGPQLPPLEVTIDKRIPVAAGLGGGSADAAAVLRAANELAGRPLRTEDLRALGASLGSDVPSQVEPRAALVTGVGERVEPVALPSMALVLVPSQRGLTAKAVYTELDRLGGWRQRLDTERLRRVATAPLEELLAAAENDLQPAVLSLRPELELPLRTLREAGALATAVSGSGPTVFGAFADRAEAARAAAGIEGALVATTRGAG